MNASLRSMIVIAICARVFLASGLADDPDLASILRRGDALDEKLETHSALAVYLEGEKSARENAELLRRIAKEYSELMADTDSPNQKRELGGKSLDYAKRAVAADPRNGMAQLGLAIGYGRLALLLDNKTKIEYAKLVKECAEKSRALDPNEDLVYHVLGAWNYELSILNPVTRSIAELIYGELPHASMEDAAENFRHAIKLNPRRLASHVELGRTYAAMGRKAEAREELQRGLAMPNRYKNDSGYKRLAAEALRQL